VSPSVVAYLIREQFYKFVPRKITLEDSFPRRLEYSLYIMSVKEWNLDSLMYRILWDPIKGAGRLFKVFTFNVTLVFSACVYLLGYAVLAFEDSIPPIVHEILPFIFSFIGLLFVLKAFTEKKSIKLSWLLVMMNHFYIALAVSFNEHFRYEQTMLYLSGIILFGLGGYLCLYLLQTLEKDIDLDRFHGHGHMYPGLAFGFLVCCLSVAGFPISPTFIGEDLIFTHIHEDQIVFAFFVALSYVVTGLTIIRLYARVFLGPHVRSVYETGYRSS
jgi:NADH-quinone oxidoreductase subunit L